MRISYLSDLHLEHYDYELTFPTGDAVLLAGDICHASDLANWRYSLDRQERRDHTLWFFDNLLERFDHVIYCMGNHEHFNFNFYETYDALEHALPSDVRILEKDAVEIDGIVFFGATLWTDFNGGEISEMVAAQEKMPEYKYVAAGHERLSPEIVMQEHSLTLRNLAYASKKAVSKPVVVVTHHAPSPQGLNPDHNGNGVESAFASDLTGFIKDHPNIRNWVFGHTHIQTEFDIGSCRLTANCKGYRELDRSEQSFNPKSAFNIEHTRTVAA